MASAGETADPGLNGLNMDNDKVKQKGVPLEIFILNFVVCLNFIVYIKCTGKCIIYLVINLTFSCGNHMSIYVIFT